jgi:DNA-binding XRE family transcriptional regulator
MRAELSKLAAARDSSRWKQSAIPLDLASICFHPGYMPDVRGSELRRRRVELGMKKSELAHQCQISARYVAELEKEHYAPRIEVLSRLAAVLGCSVASLMQDPECDPLTAGTAA